MDEDALARVREIARRFPGVTERLSHGATCFFVQDKRPICYFHDHHHGDDRLTFWCPAPPGVAEEAAMAEPERFFRPPTSSSGVFSGWLGVVLAPLRDQTVDWDEVAAIIEEAFRLVAPRHLVVELDERP